MLLLMLLCYHLPLFCMENFPIQSIEPKPSLDNEEIVSDAQGLIEINGTSQTLLQHVLDATNSLRTRFHDTEIARYENGHIIYSTTTINDGMTVRDLFEIAAGNCVYVPLCKLKKVRGRWQQVSIILIGVTNQQRAQQLLDGIHATLDR